MVDLEYLKRNVFPGESGGDYNALFGYANRPGGQFAGVNLTDMTVDQALAFADPSGPYAQSVKGQIGRVATPMGAYQIVGRTLRGAKQGLGLTGSERMTPELQDQLGMWIYQNQGPQAWEAWGRGGGGGNITTSTKGGSGMVGLLDMQESEPQTFGQRLKGSFKSGDLMDRLALAFNSMRMNPDQGIAQLVSERQQGRAAERTANRTAQWLASIGRGDLAQAMMSGALDPKAAAQIAMTPPEQQGQVGQVVDAAVLRQQFPGAQIEDGLYNAKPDGTITKVGGGGTTVNVGGSAQSELSKKTDAEEATALGVILKAAPKAAAVTADLDLLTEVLQYAPQDPISGRISQLFPGVSSAGAAAQSIIKRVAPSLRVEGSGSTSDIEYKGMLESLPSLVNYPEANTAIAGMMRAKAQLDVERGNIVRQWQNSDRSPEATQAMRNALMELDTRSIMTPEMRRVISGLSGAEPAPAAAPPTGAPAAPAVGTIKNGYRFMGGDPADQNNWERI